MNKKVEEALLKLVGDNPALVETFRKRIDDVNRSATSMISRAEGDPPAEDVPEEAPVEEAPAEVESVEVNLALSPEEISAIAASLVATPEFITAVADAIAAGLVVADAVPAKEETAVAEEVMTEIENSINELSEGIKTLTSKIAHLEKDDEQKVRERVQDRPAKFNKVNYRARAAVLPEPLREMNMSEIAAETLANMGE